SPSRDVVRGMIPKSSARSAERSPRCSRERRCPVSRPLALAACCFLVNLSPAAPPPKAKEPGPTFLDLTHPANHKLKDDCRSGRYPGNNLASLPAGTQTFAGVKFHVGDGLVQMGSDSVKGKPEKVEGIKVGRMLERLHFLHATGYSAPDGTVIAKY